MQRPSNHADMIGRPHVATPARRFYPTMATLRSFDDSRCRPCIPLPSSYPRCNFAYLRNR
jgi:hypothetical protein